MLARDSQEADLIGRLAFLRPLKESQPIWHLPYKQISPHHEIELVSREEPEFID